MEMKENKFLINVLKNASENFTNRSISFYGSKKSRITYGEIYRRAEAMAVILKDEGISQGDHIFICIDDMIKFTDIFWGAVYAGIVIELVPFDSDALANSVQGENLITESQVKILISDKADFSCSEWLNNINILSADTLICKIDNLLKSETWPKKKENINEFHEMDVAFALYTSGTKGKPKRIEFNNIQVVSSMERINSLIGRVDENVTLNILPLFHVIGFFMFYVAPVQLGIDQIQIPYKEFVSNPKLLFEVLKDRIVSDIDGMNYVLRTLSEIPVTDEEKMSLGRVKNILLCGEVMDVSLIDRVQKKYNTTAIRTFYGMTECLSCVTMAGREEYNTLDLSPFMGKIEEMASESYAVVKGRANAGTNANGYIALLNENGELITQENLPGEIGISVNCIGNMKNLKENATYYHTKDLGVMSNGELYVIGRVDDMMIVNGLHYYPGDIEAEISTAILGGRYDLALISDDRNGSIFLFVETDDETILSEQKVKKIRSLVYKNYSLVIDSIHTLPKIPKTASGKKNRRLLMTCLNEDNALEKRIDSIELIRLEADLLEKEHVRIPLHEIASIDNDEQLAELIRKYKEKSYIQLPERLGDPYQRNMPFHLTQMQQAYLIGQDEIFDISNLRTMLYYEFDCNADINRLERAFQKVIDTQPALRLNIDEKGMQSFLSKEETIFTIEEENVSDLERAEMLNAIKAFRKEVREDTVCVGAWPLYRFKAFRISKVKSILCAAVDLIALDAGSVSMFFQLVAKAYDDPKVEYKESSYTFRDYVIEMDSMADTMLYKEDKTYWNKKLADFPPVGMIKMLVSPSAISKPHFDRVEFRLSKEEVEKFTMESEKLRVSPSVVLMAIYGRVLAYETGRGSCGLNVTIFNRYINSGEADILLGEFTSTIFVNVGFKRESSFAEMLKEFQVQVYSDLEHRLYSGIEQGRDYKKLNHFTGTSVSMPYIFTSTLGTSEAFPAVFGELSYAASQTTQVYIDCQASWRADGGILISWDYVKELYDREYISTLLDRMHELITSFINNNDPLQVPMLSSKDRELLSEYNSTYVEWKPRSMTAAFKDTAEKLPGKTAIKDKRSLYTFRQLDQLSNGIAKKLISDGVKPDDFVAVLCERRKESVALMLGILKAGAAYVPVEIKNPETRRNEIVSDSGSKMLLTTAYLIDVQPSTDTIDLASPEKRAYVIYTSGSTGKPKGVVITHKSAMNTIDDINRTYLITEKDTIIGLSSMAFDLSVYDIFGAMSSGATLVMVPELYDLSNITKTVIRERITVWNSVPAIVQMYISELERQEEFEDSRGHKCVYASSNAIRLMIMSGDWIPVDLPERIQRVLPGMETISMGGATEASIWSIYYPIRKVEKGWRSIPYGMPLANQTMYVLNDNLEQCPIDAEGDIWIGGAGVAVEYLNDLIKTEKAFISHPLLGKIYRTGDRGCMRREGYMEFCGRYDGQVKIAGNRIELGEIENNILKIPGIRECTAVIDNSRKFSPRIYAFYTGEELDEELTLKQLQEFLVSYMIPEKIIHIDNIPLTGNQKIDRKRLLEYIPKIDFKLELPETVFEKAIAEIWKHVLKLEVVGIDQNFYDAGGDSLKLILLTSELNDYFHIYLTHSQVLETENIRQCAMLVERVLPDYRLVEREELEITPDKENRYNPFELTDIQKAYLMGRDDIYEISSVSTHGYYEYRIELNLDRLNLAINRVIAAQPMLRMVINQDGLQHFLKPEETYYEMKINDARDLSEEEFNAFILSIRDEVKQEMRDVSQWPLFSLQAVRRNNIESILIFSADLLCMDAASVGLFKTQVMNTYLHPEAPVEESEFSFRDFVVNLSVINPPEKVEADRKYWIKKIQDFPIAPSLLQKMSAEDVVLPHFERVAAKISALDMEKLNSIAIEMRVTSSVLLLTLYGECLAFWSGQEQTGINVTIFNKYPMHPDIHTLIGDFTSTMLIAVDGINRDFSNNAKKIQEDLIQGLEHRAYTGISVGRDLKKMRNLRKQGVIPYVFTSTLGSQIEELEFGEEIYSASQTSQVYLDCQIMYSGKDVSVTWDYVVELFDKDMMKNIFSTFINSIYLLLENRDPESAFVLSKEEVELINDYNNTSKELPKNTIVEVFNHIVERMPYKIAVKDTGKSYTFHKLDKVSNSVADKLTHLGIGKGDFVGLIGDRHIETIALLLGILKAGAAYVPVERNHPKERIQEILKKSRSKAIIDSNWLVDNVITESNTVHKGAGRSEPAYTIFTSGSTGKPKGVLITMEAVMNTVFDINQRFEVTQEDVILGLSAMNFDLSVYDVFAMMSTGATLVMVKDLYDTAEIYEQADNEKITLWNSVPALIQMMTFYQKSEKKNKLESIRLVMMSGDYIPLTLPEQIREYEPNAQLISLGGATEGSIWSIYYPINQVSKEWKSIPYGMPLSNQTFYVLNGNRVPCPVGIEGDLWIGGVGVAAGYQNDLEKTEAAFVEDKRFGRIYKTGDRGRMTSQGYIEFLGRKDGQIKLNGHRVELGEIEHAVCDAVRVNEAVADVVEINNSKHVYVFVAGTRQSEEEIIKRIKKVLPSYMIPSGVIVLDKMLLTANQKVDRKALRNLISEKGKKELKAPCNRIQKDLCEIWKKVLQINSIGIDQSYYNLGGDSIRALQLISETNKKFHVSVPLSLMQNIETIEEMADVIEHSEEIQEDITYIETHLDKMSNVYLLPPLVGSAVAYMPLAEHMPDVPMTLFDYRIFSSLKEATEVYAEKILALSEGRDIIVGGHSAGGNLAYSVAAYLEKKGVSIKALIMLDSFYFKNIEQYDTEKLKRNFRILIKQMIIRNNQIDFDFDEEGMNNYMDLLLTANTAGKIHADIYFVKSEPPYIKFGKVESVPEAWVKNTTGTFFMQQGLGFHPLMLVEPFIKENAEIIRKNIKKGRNHMRVK